MKRLVLFCAVLCLVTTAMAQKSPFKYGSIPLSELKMTRYEKDTTADAVYLFRYASSAATWTSSNGYIGLGLSGRGRDLQTNLKVHGRLKILKANGVHQGTITIPLYGADMIDVKGVTYNLENGQITATPLTSEGKFNDHIVTDVRFYKIAFPNVKVGSVLEYSLSVAKPFEISTYHDFQVSIPTLHSEFWAIAPEDFELEKFMQGYIPATKFETKNLAVEFGSDVVGYHWIIKDVPAFRTEPYMQAKESLISAVRFSIKSSGGRTSARLSRQGTWEDISKRLANSHLFAGIVSSSFFVQPKARELVNGLDDPLDKVRAIHTFVRQTIKWNKWDSYSPYVFDLKKVWDEKKGNSSDVNLLLAALLDKVGFKPQMVMLRTREYGPIRKENPTSEQFNHVICRVTINGDPILLDATEKFLPYDLLPQRSMADEGLLISDGNPVWIPITSSRKTTEQVSAEMQQNEKGEITGKINFLFDGYYAAEMRSAIDSSANGRWQSQLESNNLWHSVKSEVKNLNDLMKPSELNFDVIYSAVPWQEDIVYLNPNVVFKMNENPFKAEQRIYPVDMGHSSDRKYFIKIKIPDGYYAEDLPGSSILRLPDNSARFTYNTNISNNMITVTSVLSITKSNFSQAEYPDLREFYNQVVAKQSEMIVLKRR